MRELDGIDQDLLYQVAQDMENSGATKMRSVVDEGCCFPAGTRIHTDKRLVRIEDIKVGDRVLSKPESGKGELAYKPVVRIVSYEDKEIWDMTYFEIKANTDTSKLLKGKLLQLSHKGKMVSIAATPNHPFWVKGAGWTRLDQLETGNIIETHDPELVALVFFVKLSFKTNLSNVAACYHPRNVFEADQKGFDIPDVDCFDFVEYDSQGVSRFLGEGDELTPIVFENQQIDILNETFTTKVYSFEVDESHTYFITDKGLWVHNTNCPCLSPENHPKDLVTRFGTAIPKIDAAGRPI